MATIATHNGSKVCREHNIRNEKVTSKQKHIDPNGRHEILHDEKLRDAYKRLFRKAQLEFDRKQTKAERKIYDYYTHIKNDKLKHLVYEMIVGVYGKDVTDVQKEDILREFAAGWKERNPNLELIGAYFHDDEEGDMHIHFDYIPVAYGLKRGMEVQNSLTKALGQMGFKTQKSSNTAQMQWERRENLHLEELCRKRGINVERPTEANKEHLETEMYKLQQELLKTQEKLQEAQEARQAIRDELSALKAQKGGIGFVGPLKAEISTLEQTVNDQKEQIRSLEGKVRAKEAENINLKDEVERQKESKASLDAYIAKAEEQRQEYTRFQQFQEHLKEKMPWLYKQLQEAYKAFVKIFHLDRGGER